MRDRPIGVDLFAGAGGLSLGFEQAGFDVLAAVEFDPIHCATHEFNFPDCKVFCKSVTDITGDEIRAESQIGGQDLDVVFGGSPCQGYSLIGKRALDDPRNSLVRDFVRLVCELRPKYFVFENVPGLTIGKHRAFLQEIVDEFSKGGYSVRLPWRVLQASEFGVPQSRRRLFLFGSREGMPMPDYPEAVSRDRRHERMGDLFGILAGPSVIDAIGDLPNIDDFDQLLSSDLVQTELGRPSAYAATLRGLVRDLNDYSYNRDFVGGTLTSSMRTIHTEESVKRFSETEPGSVEKISRFLRLDPNGLCNTLRAGTATERGAFTSARPIHPLYPRCISVREAARLHGYPDWFRFHVTKWHGFRQVGNSVPPPLGRAVAGAVMTALNLTPTVPESVRPLGDPALLHLALSSAGEHFNLASGSLPRRSRHLVGA